MTTERQMTWDEVVAEMVRYRESAKKPDDLLRQAIDALRVVKTSVSPDTIIGIKIAAVLTAYDKRSA